MCRAANPGAGQPAHPSRRCPYHQNPHVAAVANAKTSIRRLERRVDRLENDGAPDEKLNSALERLYTAHERLGTREQIAIPDTGRPGAKPPASAIKDQDDAEPKSFQALPAPRPSAADSLTRESVRDLFLG